MAHHLRDLAYWLANRAPAGAPIQTRRAFLRNAASLLAAGVTAPVFANHPSGPRPKFQAYPFPLGVASGYPSSDSVVLWTRIAAQPLNGGAIGTERVQVGYEVAEDMAFKRIVVSSEVRAASALAHSVHVEPRGLRAGREYWYRFFAGHEVSPVGRFRTAPSGLQEKVRIALGTCQHFEHGYFAAYQHMLREDPDLIVFTGDYIYEVSWGDDLVRSHAGDKCMTLEDFRNRHAQYKSDPDLQAAHAHCPWLFTWDDHEVENDYANAVSETLDPNFLLRRAFAYQAYYEHMPVPRQMLPRGAAMPIHGSFDYGALLRFHILDTRQYRTEQPCPPENRHGSRSVTDAECAQRRDPAQTMLGEAQEQWLEQSFESSKARWNLIVQSTLFAQEKQDSATQPRFFTDSWDGYPLARQRLLDTLQRQRVRNPILVGGDVHAHYVTQVRANADQPDSPVVAHEFCTTSLNAQGPEQARTEQNKALNPDIFLARSDTRGYQLLEITPTRLTAQVQHTLDEKVPVGETRLLAQFSLAEGASRLDRIT